MWGKIAITVMLVWTGLSLVFSSLANTDILERFQSQQNEQVETLTQLPVNDIKNVDKSLNESKLNIDKTTETISANPLENPISFNTSAQSMAIIEAKSGRLISSKNMNEKLKNASTTKVLTAITVIENCKDLDEKFVINDKAVGVEGSSIYLRKGERLSARELLYGLMLRSGNDTAVALALHIRPTIEEFAVLMNEMSLKIGAKNSHWMNPHGLDDDNHYTTAYDLALISAYAINNPTFKEIVSTKTIKISGGEEEFRYLSNKNKLLTQMDGCVGVKTGYTKKAGRCLVSAIEKNNAIFVCVVLNCGPMFEDSKVMLEKSSDHVIMTEILEPYTFVKQINVENGKKTKVKCYINKGFSYPILEMEKSNINIEYDLPVLLTAPIKAEQNLGKARVFYKNILLCEVDVLAMEEVESESMLEELKDIIEKW